ncbi:hypothetical protein GXP67_20675 [Rhodocytophaga rosea]|uniref:TIR domain-containing protein n=1 Tax=Rhodocytophaga rosea TaxID=2704465 RepID=A0A6C0GLD2_9BACT|nr:hypothetical protein [Rhodocytophaga rosea]QHT68891.1 hypothetical protein GXP67_20675 [Rhodocytophaga rosea]
MADNYQICISYTTSDSTPIEHGERNWISGFQQFLEKMLNRLFEAKLDFMQYSEQEPLSAQQLAKVDVFICVLSPAYLQSMVCLKNLAQIDAVLRFSDPEQSAANKRIFKVIKYPIKVDGELKSLKSLPGYNLYAPASHGEATEIHDFNQANLTKEVRLELADLIYDLYETLSSLHNPVESPVEKIETSGNAIYLAETSADLMVERHIIKRDLQKYGFKVLPEHKLPENVQDMETMVRKDLARCKLSIHLVGDSYTEIFSGNGRSIVELQNKFAVEHSRTQSTRTGDTSQDPAFSRLIWLSPGEGHIPQMRKYLQQESGRHFQTLEGAEVFQTSLENFKSAIWEELTETSSRDMKRPASVAHRMDVYMIYDKPDSKEIVSIISQLQTKEIRLSQPVFEADRLHIRQIHLEKLATADIIIIYKHKADEQWLRMKAIDVLKAPGYGRSKPILEKVIFTQKDTIIDKSFYESNGFSVVSNWELYIDTLLAHFIAQAQEKHG